MSDPSGAGERRLRIVHILRSPLGGLFRHVLDLARGQAERGHAVGLIADAATGGAAADAAFAALAPMLTLGIARLPMHRDPHPADALALRRTARLLRQAQPDVVHGHGAKGGLYARLPALLPFARRGALRVYTPHGGSLHHDPRSFKGAAILRAERLLAQTATDLILFESGYAAERFQAVVGAPACAARIVHNGLGAAEFAPVPPQPDAADILYVGEFRFLKGVDVLLRALAALHETNGQAPSAVLVGSGPDRAAFEALAATLDLRSRVTFHDAMPARQAFGLGRLLVVPSRAESLPYIVLEAAAAHLPLLASRVGGIPEILAEAAEAALVAPGDVAALRDALAARLAQAPDERAAAAARLAASVQQRFSAARMTEAVLAGYRDAFAARRAPAPLRPHAAPALRTEGS